MNIKADIPDPVAHSKTVDTSLLKRGAEGFEDYVQKSAALGEALAQLARVGDAAVRENALRLTHQLNEFEPAITMIGQVKAGKTSLVNAMVGWPELLPADVNPWTSVVTSLHMAPKSRGDDNRARFRFFDETEWDRLVEKGGRIGELAARAGAEEELVKVRRQIEEMREKSRIRLGRRFELLLGQEHDYGYFDQDLVERYVCLGDTLEDEADLSDKQGRFADITKSADLYFTRPEFPTRLCVRDTPGVNDTFMMREQITIQAIRGSRLCVVVLSAHQALSSVDMALIRLISNIKSREVVIFVNRIDELADPTRQVPEIRDSIRVTLKNHDGPADAQIIFGSAYWANKAMSGDLKNLSQDSAGSLLNWAESALASAGDPQTPAQMIWELSGMPTLLNTLGQRICETVGTEMIDRVARKAVNLANGMRATNQVVWLQQKTGALPNIDKNALSARLTEIEARNRTLLDQEFDTLTKAFHDRIDRSHHSFLDRATASLINHLERFGEEIVWQYDPAGLRMLLRSAYRIFGTRAQGAATVVYETTAEELTTLFAESFGQPGASFELEPPPAPQVPPPVFLGQTIALDLQFSWWKNWWQKRRGYQAFAANFHEMIMKETDPIVEELKHKQIDGLQRSARDTLDEFLAEQRTLLMGVVDGITSGAYSAQDIKNKLGLQARENRENAVEDTLNTLNRYVG